MVPLPNVFFMAEINGVDPKNLLFFSPSNGITILQSCPINTSPSFIHRTVAISRGPSEKHRWWRSESQHLVVSFRRFFVRVVWVPNGFQKSCWRVPTPMPPTHTQIFGLKKGMMMVDNLLVRPYFLGEYLRFQWNQWFCKVVALAFACKRCFEKVTQTY